MGEAGDMGGEGLEDGAVGEGVGVGAEVDGDAVGEGVLLDVAVGGEEAVVGHLGIADSAGDGAGVAVAGNEAVLVLVQRSRSNT